ncbi:MAG: lipopolysaccharide transport periplasmic protein LptA [Alphaproteobacteria bacterium]
MKPVKFAALRWALLWLLGAMFAGSLQAFAQGLATPLSNMAVNAKAPIQIEADNLEIDDNKKNAVFSGRVIATQEKMRLTTDKLVINYRSGKDGGNPQLRTIDARGNVVMKVRDQVATGAWAHYNLLEEKLTLSGKVVLSQGKNVIRGEKIVVNLKTGRSQMFSSKNTKSGGRVRGLFTPNRRPAKAKP